MSIEHIQMQEIMWPAEIKIKHMRFRGFTVTDDKPHLDDLTQELQDMVFKNLDCRTYAQMFTSTKYADDVWESACHYRGWVPRSPDVSWRIHFAKMCIVSIDNEYRCTTSHGERLEWSLAKAATAGHRDKVEMLLAGVEDLGAEYGYLLYLASRHCLDRGGNADVVQLLLQIKRLHQTRDNVDPRAASATDATSASDGEYEGIALCIASFGGHTDIVKVLIEADVDVNASDFGFGDRFATDPCNRFATTAKEPALDRTNFRGHIHSTKISMTWNATQPGGAHSYGQNPLCYASMNGHVDVVQQLVMAGADINAHNFSAMRAASKAGRVDVVKLLIAFGAEVSAGDDVALLMATSFGHASVVELLLHAKSKVNERTLHAACRRGNLDILKMLLGAATPGSYDIIVLLQVATRFNSRKLYPLLDQIRIDRGIDIPDFLLDDEDNSCLHHNSAS